MDLQLTGRVGLGGQHRNRRWHRAVSGGRRRAFCAGDRPLPTEASARHLVSLPPGRTPS
jgi:hypothetical protein